MVHYQFKKNSKLTKFCTIGQSNNRVPNGGIIHGVDVRYAATYGNPHLRSNAGLGFTVNTAKPASTPAPPPYSSVRSSVILPSGKIAT